MATACWASIVAERPPGNRTVIGFPAVATRQQGFLCTSYQQAPVSILGTACAPSPLMRTARSNKRLTGRILSYKHDNPRWRRPSKRAQTSIPGFHTGVDISPGEKTRRAVREVHRVPARRSNGSAPGRGGCRSAGRPVRATGLARVVSGPPASPARSSRHRRAAPAG